MEYIEEIANDLDNEIIKEIMKYGTPNLEDYNDVTNIAVKLANELKADADVVLLGSKFMHSKVGEAIQNKKWAEHTNMALGFAMEFFKNYPLNENIKNKIFACIKEHREKKFTCIEAEICANANCYRYLIPRKVLKAFFNMGKQGYSFDEIYFLVGEKIDQKWQSLTLEICKKELENNYLKIKEFLELCRNQGKTI